MYLTRTAIKAANKEAERPNEEPIRVVSESKQHEFLNEWRRELENAGVDISAQLAPSTHGKARLIIHIGINPGNSRGYGADSHSITLQFVDDVLQFWSGYQTNLKAPVSGVEHLFRLIDAVKKKLHEQQAREQKKQKVKDLKTRSVEAQIEGLAQRLQFAYQLKRMHTKVVLVVELDNRQALFVDIPLGKIQETIDRLEELIQQVKELYGEGLRFKIAGTPYGSFHRPSPVE